MPAEHLQPQFKLNSLTSIFENALAQEPEKAVDLGELLSDIKGGRWAQEIAKVRRYGAGTEQYNKAKKKLPAFSMSGCCLTRDAQVKFEDKFIQHSGFLQCDFDRKDNPHMQLTEVTELLKADAHVAFGFISPSGEGLKCGLRIDPERHLDSFLSADKYFLEKYALQIDKSTKDPLRLCFVSFDPNLWYKEATALPVMSFEKRKAAPLWRPPLESTAADISEMLRFIPPRPDYEKWLRIASAVWSVLDLQTGSQVLNAWSPEEKAGEYADKHKHRLQQIGVGSLVHLAAEYGFDARAAANRKRWAGRIRFADGSARSAVERLENAAVDPSAEIQHVELSRPFVQECFEKAQLGDAELWAAVARGKKLYDHLSQCWRSYTRGIWEKDSMGGTITECIRTVADAFRAHLDKLRAEIDNHPAPEGSKDARFGECIRIEQRIKQLHMRNYAVNVVKFAEELLPTMATKFDHFPGLLCLENGTLDFEDGSFREHRPTDMLTVRSPIHFNPDADCPKWRAFLEFAFSGKPDVIAYLARAVGYSLTGYVDKDALFFNHGSGANGKSTFTAVLQMLAGALNTVISIEALLAKSSDQNHDYKKAMLEGKRIVFTDEIPENKVLNDSAIKALIGGDMITARRPYERPYVFAPTHKLWLVGNHKPEIRGADHGIWRRIHLIAWENIIPEDKRRVRHEVLAELRAELAGILNWAILGFIDMQDNGGLRPPAAVQAAVSAYRKAGDQLGAFLDDRTEKSDEDEERVRMDKLLKAYLAWCQDNGERPRYESTRKLTATLSERGHKLVEGKARFKYITHMRLIESE